jgi:putative hemolysin
LILYLIPLVFFLLLSVFFSGSETAFMAVDRLRLKFLAESGDKTAASIKDIVSNPDRFLGVILLGNTISNIGAASLVTFVVTSYVPRDRTETAGIVSTIVLTLIVLIFCELSPKMLAAAHSEALCRRLIGPIRFSMWFLSPFARLAGRLANVIVRLAGMSAPASPFAHALSEEEIRAIIEGSATATIADEKKEMLANVFEIGATRVRSVMIPRMEVTAVEVDAPVREILDLVQKTNYSRIPVYRQNFDNILGILNVKDLLQKLGGDGEINLKVMLRPAHFVPDMATLEAVLHQMQSMHLHMAIVVDEFGGVEGIVTLEDLLEEIVGEIRDEHDMETESVRELGPNLYSVAGSLPVKDFNRMFDVEIPESPDYATIVGFLQARTGRLLQEGESIRYKTLAFSIEKVEGFKAVSVRVRLPLAKSAEPASPAQKT